MTCVYTARLPPASIAGNILKTVPNSCSNHVLILKLKNALLYYKFI